MKISVVKTAINWILPFLKDNKAVEIVKKDIKSLGEEFITRSYDFIKNLFVIDQRRKTAFEQWEAALEKEQTPNADDENLVKTTVENVAKDDANFLAEIKKLLDNGLIVREKNIVKGNVEDVEEATIGDKVPNPNETFDKKNIVEGDVKKVKKFTLGDGHE